jgi:WD40 repeat protein
MPIGVCNRSRGNPDLPILLVDNPVRIWDGKTYNLFKEITFEEPIMSLAWDPKGDALVVVDASWMGLTNPGTVILWQSGPLNPYAYNALI